MTTPQLQPAVVEIVADLSRPLAPEERYRRLLAALRRVFPLCDAAALLELQGDELVPMAVDGLSEDTLGRRFPLAAQPRLAQILLSTEPVRFVDSDLPDPYDGLVEGGAHSLAVHDCMGATLQVDGRPWGVLTLDALAPGSFDRIRPEELRGFIALAEASVQAAQAIAALREQVDREQRVNLARRDDQRRELIGRSAAMQQLRREIDTVALSDLAVLILGETGVGKELVAEQLHARSRRAERPLVYVNCAALPETLAESELFGHRRGAFTGADRDRTGKFELADGGTLFLDEVGELPPAVQAKLLRALQSGEIQRPGSDQLIRVDVRVIAATNRELQREVSAGRFRADLYHRLSVFPLPVPPLRERGRDVLALAGFFLEREQRRLGVRNLRLSAAAQQALLAYDWPGNVRELEHLLSRAALRALAQQGRDQRWLTIESDQLTLTAGGEPAASSQAVLTADTSVSLREATDRFQREWLQRALAEQDGNLAATARVAGVDRSNLLRLMNRLGMR